MFSTHYLALLDSAFPYRKNIWNLRSWIKSRSRYLTQFKDGKLVCDLDEAWLVRKFTFWDLFINLEDILLKRTNSVNTVNTAEMVWNIGSMSAVSCLMFITSFGLDKKIYGVLTEWQNHTGNYTGEKTDNKLWAWPTGGVSFQINNRITKNRQRWDYGWQK